MDEEFYSADDSAFFTCEESEELWTEVVKDERPVRLNVIIFVPPHRVPTIEEIRPIVKRHWRPQQAQAPPIHIH